MIPPYIDGAASALAFSTRVATRAETLFRRTAADVTALPVPEADENTVPPTAPRTGDWEVSIQQMFLRTQGEQWKGADYLFVLLLRHAHAEPQPGIRSRIHFVAAETIRSRAGTLPHGTVVGSMPVGTIPFAARATWEIAGVLYRIGRSPEARRVLKTIAEIVPGLDYDADPLGSLALAEAVLDRLAVLRSLSSVEISLASTCSAAMHSIPGQEACHVVFLAGPDPRDDARHFCIRDEALCLGHDLNSASPFYLREYAVIRVGPRDTGRVAPRSIDQLLRERALRGGTAPTDEDAQEHESFLDREARLRTVRRLTAIYGSEALARVPAVEPIGVEVAGNLARVLQLGRLDTRFHEELDQMREGLRAELGMEFPGVRIRGNDSDMPDSTYLIMLNEIPLVMGTVRPGKLLCDATVEQLRLIGVTAEVTNNPANGNESSWIDDTDRERVERDGQSVREGLHLWTPSEYIVLHLSAVLRKNASEYLGIKAVADLLRAKARGSLAAIRSAPGGLRRFTEALQVLIEEEVAIRDLPAICGCYLGAAASGLSKYEIADELRQLKEIRPLLRWRDDVYVYQLGARFVTEVRKGLQRHGDEAALCLEPEITQELLGVVREEVTSLPPDSPNPVLLVEDWRLRRPLRKLVELEFPHLRVLARRELVDLPPDAITVVATIEWTDTPPRRRRRAGR